MTSTSYFVRAIALTILSFMTSAVIIAFTQGFVIGFVLVSDGESSSGTVAGVGALAVLLASALAVVGLIASIDLYREGVVHQSAELVLARTAKIEADSRERKVRHDTTVAAPAREPVSDHTAPHQGEYVDCVSCSQRIRAQRDRCPFCDVEQPANDQASVGFDDDNS